MGLFAGDPASKTNEPFLVGLALGIKLTRGAKATFEYFNSSNAKAEKESHNPVASFMAAWTFEIDQGNPRLLIRYIRDSTRGF
jgi:hypothetical protein